MLRDKIDIIVPSGMIFLAEGLYFTGHIETGQAVHALNIFLCFLLPLVLGTELLLYQSFALISLIRVVGLGMPKFFSLTMYNYIPIYAAAILGAIIVLRENRTMRQELAAISSMLKGTWARMRGSFWLWISYLVVGILLGLMFASIEYYIIFPESLVPSLSFANLVILGFIMIFFVGFGEELMFRAILQRRLQSKMGVWPGVLLASLVFAAMHSIYISVPYLAYVFAVGLVLGVIYQRTKSLSFVSLVHGSINFFLFSLIPLGALRLF